MVSGGDLFRACEGGGGQEGRSHAKGRGAAIDILVVSSCKSPHSTRHWRAHIPPFPADLANRTHPAATRWRSCRWRGWPKDRDFGGLAGPPSSVDCHRQQGRIHGGICRRHHSGLKRSRWLAMPSGDQARPARSGGGEAMQTFNCHSLDCRCRSDMHATKTHRRCHHLRTASSVIQALRAKPVVHASAAERVGRRDLSGSIALGRPLAALLRRRSGAEGGGRRKTTMPSQVWGPSL